MRNATRSRTAILLFFLTAVPSAPSLGAQEPYFPPKGGWERRAPEEIGLDPALIREAVEFARANETSADPDLETSHQSGFGREPFGDAIGPLKERGPQTGVIVHRGYIVAEWGEPARVDPTFSVAKSFLSATVGLAYDRGMIADVNDLVGPYMAPIVALGERYEPVATLGNGLGRRAVFEPFSGPHNSKITWDHLLRQTSAWEGTLWGKPDWADRPARDPATWLEPRGEPGSAYEYNDTRVNVLALAALNLWRRPLPQVLREHLMNPIGASDTWRWFGYDNSWVLIDGVAMQSVSGGTHWGGGMFINAYDQARFGLLTLHRGVWDGRRILSDEWVSMSITPTPVQPGYGFMNWYLGYLRAGPDSAFAHVGAGSNIVYVDPVNDLVIVMRWITGAGANGVVERVIAAMGDES